MNKRLRVVVTAVSIASMLFLAVWLFRTRTEVHDPRGVVRYQWRWGYAKELTIDRDRDGRVDMRAIYRGHFREFAADDQPIELWVDQDFDGQFDGRWQRNDDFVVTLDKDHDGVFETRMLGAAAEAYVSRWSLFP